MSKQIAKDAIQELLNGHPPNGIEPHVCTPFEEEVQSLYDAHETGGTEAVRRAWDSLTADDDELINLLASDDPLFDLEIIDGAHLLCMDLPSPKYLVEPVLPEGTSLLVSPPKVGKTFLALNYSVAIATAGKALGSIDVAEGGVLYIDYDGSLRGMQRRLEGMLPDAEDLASMELMQKNFHRIGREFPKMDQGGLDVMRRFVERYPNTELIIIDTLKGFRGSVDGRKNMYDSDVEAVDPIRALGNELGVSFLLLHHTNKRDASDPLDSVSGSTGLTAAVENIKILRKQRGTTQATLTVVPREEEETEVALEFDGAIATWNLLGNASEIAKTEERQEILSVMRRNRENLPMKAKEIASILDKAPNNVSKLLYRMMDEGKVLKAGYGKFDLPDPVPTVPTVPTSEGGDKIVGTLGTVGQGVEGSHE